VDRVDLDCGSLVGVSGGTSFDVVVKLEELSLWEFDISEDCSVQLDFLLSYALGRSRDQLDELLTERYTSTELLHLSKQY
jgi:hypothetical protein